mgnify:FL=1|tara:strand:- start:1359 stop:1664 length:306 start_codon:yes stop_codon:yes gene_type:complete
MGLSITYKVLVEFTADGVHYKQKYKTISAFLNVWGETLNLNRQKCYRLRHNIYSTNVGKSSAHALEKKYKGITITDIKETYNVSSFINATGDMVCVDRLLK